MKECTLVKRFMKKGRVNVNANKRSEGLRSVMVDKHICWICQEVMSNEALVLGHYKKHMRQVGEDDP